MDYDDNDFQGHNLHLADEGSSKLSPVLRDYALPKFDFDDSLQGHLRFDSLVENEVFLGIPSQEDNQWIEDFSRGSSGIEFSSSATESCSISRRNNVWSEATSSESVEMLLKSVRQEERILGETIIEESDAGDELDRLTNKMEPNLKQDEKVEGAIHSEPALPPDDFPDGWNESIRAENPTVECTLEAQKDDPPVYKGFGEVDSHVYSGVIVSEGNVGSDRKCDDASQMEVDSLAKESLVDLKELPSVSGMHTGNTSSSSHKVIASSVELNTQESIYKVTDVCFENVDGLLKEISEGIEEHNVQIKEYNMVGQISSGTVDETCANNIEDPHSVPSRSESLVEEKVEINITTLEEPSELPMKGDCDFQIEEGCKNDVSSSEPSQSCNFEVVVCTEGLEICKQHQGSLLEESPVTCLVDGSPKGQAIEVDRTKAAYAELDIGSVEEKERGFGSDNQMDSLEGQNNEVGDTKGGSSFCPELEIGSVMEKEKFRGSDNEMDRRVLTEASVLPALDHKLIEQGDGSGINHVGDLSSLTVTCSSVKLLAEQSSNQNLNDVNNTPRVHKEEFLPEGHMALMLGESMQLNKKILSSEQVGVHSCGQDVPFHERDNAKLPAESSDMQCRVVGSLCPDEFSEGNIVTTHGSEFDSSTGNEPESNTVVKDKNLSSCDKLNGLPMFHGTGATADEVTPHNHGQKSPVLGVLSMGTDENEETVIELSGVNKSLQMATDVESVPEGPVSEDGKASQRDQAAVQECSKKLAVCPGLFDSTVKQVEGTEAGGCENYTEISMKRNAEVALVEISDAAVLSNKIVAPAEAISVSMVESFRQKDHETIVASGTQTTGQIGPSTKVDLSDESQVSVALTCSSKCVSDCMNEDVDNSDNLVKDNCESPTVISCTELPLSEKGQQGAIKRTTVDTVLHSEATCDNGEKVKSASLQMEKDASKEERSFTFEVRLSGLSEGETGKSWQSVPSGQVHKVSTNDEGSPLIYDHSQIDLKTVPEISHGKAQAPVGVITHPRVKGTPERKPRRGSSKAAARDNAKKGNNVKEKTPLRRSEKVDKAMMFTGSPGTVQIVQFEELKSCGDVERNGTNACGVLPIPTSNLPDLNTSVPPAAFFLQPFTDLQQVQLRAQILVYGSLIQESVPDEACMISAFGPSEGGGSLWEPAWRACIEKVRGQKSHASNSETLVQSRSELRIAGSKAPDQPVKHNLLQSKVLSSPAGRASSKGIPSPAVNPIIPLSSPLWNVSSPSCDGLQSSSMSRGLIDYHQPLSPLHPYQASGVRNFVGHSPSWLSQAPFPGSWVASPQISPFDVNTHFSVFPNTEAMKLTPAKDPSVPNFPATKHASLPAVADGGGGATVSSGTSSQPDVKMVTVSSSQHSADPKPRKRKKVPAIEGLVQIPLPTLSQTAAACGPGVGNRLSKKAPVPEVAGQKSLLAQSQTDTVPTAIVSNLSSTSVTGATPAHFVSTSNSGKYLAAFSPTSLSDQPRSVDQNVEKKNLISDKTLNTVEEAKLQAEAAALRAAAAVGHCHDVWSQLDNQRNSGLTSDVEAKLVSAAMAIAAAASVAKAAAAAAKIASNVAVQAKLMAEEVSVSSASVNSTCSTGISLSNVPNSSGNATPSSILKDGDGSAYPSSIIAVAREAARKRVEAASAASKHAENLDAIVKAAELAAEAVSQAGKIVSIGDPLPLSKLVESGSVDYWKSPQGSPEKGAKSHSVDSDQPKTVNFEELRNDSAEQSKVGPSVMEEALKPGTVASFEKDSFKAQRGRRASNLAKNIGVVPESEAGSRSASVIAEDVYTNASGMSIENRMKEGCLVEVFKDGDNCKGAWYSANILNLNDGKAFVCYTELQSDEGHLKEWVSVEGDGIEAPKIRIAHPATTMRIDGTRKRRRAAMMDYTWSVGDKVDAWMQDCWCEGIVKEKNKNDETTLTIHFPALEDTSAVRAWHLRPTLTWQDGEWIEWSSARRQSPSQGVTPQEKRVKLGSSTIEAKGKDKMSRGVDRVESKKHEESRPLPLSANEKEFNVGENTGHENKDAQRTVRTGLQKEGSRVVFGVPKPGKKRKFMDVSKHFDSDQSSKNINTNDSVKFARYLIPQGSGSRGWKNNTKIDVKERQAADKTKVLRSGNSLSASVRALPQKDNYLTSTKSAPHDATTKDQIPEDVISNEEKSSGQQNVMEFGSFSNSQDTSEGPTLVSSLGLLQVAPKKVLSSNAKSERLNKGKLAATGGRLNKKVESQDKLIPEVIEPRRSNRKIQPTSRLLEGLQSSLIISKMPSVPHDKSQRSQNRSNIKGNTNNG